MQTRLPSPKNQLASLLLWLGIAAGALLAVALTAQYGFGLHPCELCMAQRYPYVAIMVLGPGGALLGARHRRVLWPAIAACALLLALDGGIATYHAGVESGIFTGPTACSSNAAQGDSLEAMRQAIMNAPLVTCDQPMVHVLGLSMAAWNALAAWGLFAATLCIAFQHRTHHEQ